MAPSASSRPSTPCPRALLLPIGPLVQVDITCPTSKGFPQRSAECRTFVICKVKAHLDDTIVTDPVRRHRIELNSDPVVKELKYVDVAVPRPSLAAGLDVHVIHPETNILLRERVFALSHQIALGLERAVNAQDDPCSPVLFGDVQHVSVERDRHHCMRSYPGVLERTRGERAARKTRAGVSGRAVIERSAGARASHTALAMAAPSPGLPHSPRPRRPSGFVVARTSW